MLSVFSKKSFKIESRNSIKQEHPENYKEKMFEFIKSVENYRKCNDLELHQVANMDETTLFMNMKRTKTIAKIGSKTVNIKTHDQEKFKYCYYELWQMVQNCYLS